MTDVVVVGGGVAGLVAARDLAKGGAHVVLVEGSGVLGGMVRRHTVAGLDLDMAADSFATRNDAVGRLAIELGLGNEVTTPDPRGAWLMTRDGRTAPIPQTGLLGIPGSPMAADVLAVVGQKSALRAQMDSLLPSLVGSKAPSLGELVRKRMGEQVLDDLVVPIVAGVHSTHPDDLDPDRVAPGLRAALLREGSLARAVLALRARATAGSAVQGIRGGTVRLVDELVADMETYRVDVRLHTRATAIEEHAVEVRTDDGETERLVAEHVLASTADPARAAGPVRTGIELVTLVVDQHELDAAPRGTGMLVHPDAPGVRAKAITHATVKWPWLAEAAGGRHVLRLSYATTDTGVAATTPGAAVDAVETGRSLPVDPYDAIGTRAAQDASALLGVPIAPSAVVGAARVRWHGPDTTAAGLADGVVGIGEASTGRGLAGIVAAARTAAEHILDS
ncbi:FAD-dependent oxidoreductase [Curtobacterium sp. SORGH_AS_0776]|uniref:protoporphyrinogen/coproporphyrinogen oxidase n=1 Tax=Curtobacterium sp. SORGH_AS_0776 TaxID=3041798 RepID=UPI00285AD58A|nr:FAD-dependent oxidoreductase [Curtobacterium sp. SORGH_AS_0776]MDR6169824.1 oxygen-dependent protoporphyrinogen oxidase [Curtobacterium sp. SORGH_AS_0776]